MTIAIACPHCHEPLRVPRESQGRRVVCPHCRKQARVPRLDAQPEILDAEQIPEAVPTIPGPWPGITGMVVGIVGVVLVCIPFLSFPLATAATVFSYIGMQRKRGRGMAIAGLSLGIVGLVLSILVIIISVILSSVNETNASPRQTSELLRLTSPESKLMGGNVVCDQEEV